MSWWWWFWICYIAILYGFIWLWKGWMTEGRGEYTKAQQKAAQEESIREEAEHWRQWREERDNKSK